jgi:hypothetical protein
MPQWTINSVVDVRSGATQKTIVAQWFDSQTPSVQAAFLTRMKFLQALPYDGWDRPYVGQLRGKPCKGLYEIVITVGNVQHRPIGYFSAIMEFTIVAFATERDGQLVPRTVCETSKQTIKRIAEGREKVRVISF